MPDITISRRRRTATGTVTAQTMEAGIVTLKSSTPGPEGPAGADGTNGAPATPGLRGYDGGPAFLFNEGTDDVDPGVGQFSFDNDVIASVTYLYCSFEDAFANDLTSWMQVWDDTTSTIRGYLLLKKNNTGAICTFAITGEIVEGEGGSEEGSSNSLTHVGYYKIPVSYVSGVLYTNADLCMVQFVPVGGMEEESSSGGLGDTYTNATPVPEEIGGIAAGSTFDEATMQEMWDLLLYPYQYPAFLSFSISGQGTTLECGVYVTAGAKTFVWDASNDANVEINSIDIDDVTRIINLITGTANNNSESLTITAVTSLSTGGTNTWRITGTNTNAEDFTRNWAVTWYSPYYYGVGAQDLMRSQVQQLTKVVTSSGNKNYAFSPTNQVYYFAYPASYGELSSILDTNGFETIGDWTLRVENFLNNSPYYEGGTVSYNIYEFNNPTTQTNFTNHFIY